MRDSSPAGPWPAGLLAVATPSFFGPALAGGGSHSGCGQGAATRGRFAITTRSIARLSWMTWVRHAADEGLNISR
jgi:hypothetical protein